VAEILGRGDGIVDQGREATGQWWTAPALIPSCIFLICRATDCFCDVLTHTNLICDARIPSPRAGLRAGRGRAVANCDRLYAPAWRCHGGNPAETFQALVRRQPQELGACRL